jgi:uncharacterized protein (DUF2342 family)
MEVAVQMPQTSNILERLRWKVGLGLVVLAAGFAAQSAPVTHSAADVARSSWGFAAPSAAAPSSEPADASTDVARSSWGFAAPSAAATSSEQVDTSTDVARSSWGIAADSSDVA